MCDRTIIPNPERPSGLGELSDGDPERKSESFIFLESDVKFFFFSLDRAMIQFHRTKSNIFEFHRTSSTRSIRALKDRSGGESNDVYLDRSFGNNGIGHAVSINSAFSVLEIQRTPFAPWLAILQLPTAPRLTRPVAQPPTRQDNSPVIRPRLRGTRI
jgi:hypothetical protein